MFGAAQSWHWPVVENVVFTQLMHSVLSALGPVPAPHAEQVVRSLLTTFGALHSTHSMPNVEYSMVVALPTAHCVQSLWSAFDCLPGGQTSQRLLPSTGYLPSSHC